MQTMRCGHCEGEVSYLPQDDGKAFLCPACGKPGVYGFAINPASRTASSPLPAISATPAKRSGAGMTAVKVVGGGAIGAAALFGVLGKGARHVPKALKPAATRTLPTQIPSKFVASPYRAPLAPSASPAPVSSSSGFLPLHAGAHGVRAMTQPSGDERQEVLPISAPNGPVVVPNVAP